MFNHVLEYYVMNESTPVINDVTKHAQYRYENGKWKQMNIKDFISDAKKIVDETVKDTMFTQEIMQEYKDYIANFYKPSEGTKPISEVLASLKHLI